MSLDAVPAIKAKIIIAVLKTVTKKWLFVSWQSGGGYDKTDEKPDGRYRRQKKDWFGGISYHGKALESAVCSDKAACICRSDSEGV